ncbi:MAG: DUF2628 domain-containing protein [Rhizobiaceae bacterium]|nr:DUF2628 domain-containing protein [Rhizobiaceae bacterium]
MASFVVLVPDDNEEEAVIIRDGFSILALILPFLWLLWHRLWFAAAMVILASIGLGAAMQLLPDWVTVFAVASMLLSLFIALEGNAMRIASKERQGWRLRAIVEAQNRATAEEIYFAPTNEAAGTAPVKPESTLLARQTLGQKTAGWQTPSRQTPGGQTPGGQTGAQSANAGPALGLLDYENKG